MEGLLTNYYEYHFLYIAGIHHVESQEHPGHGPDEALLPPRHEHGPGDGRDDRLRHPVAGVHAAGDRLAVHHPVRRRQRPGRLPRPLERDQDRSARSRTRRSSRSGRCSPACPGVSAPPPFGGSQRTVVVRVDPDRLRSYKMSPDEVITAPRPPATRSARRATSGSATRCRSCRSTRWSGRSTELETIPIRPGANPTVYLRDVATVQDASRHPHRLRPGQRPPGGLHPGDQAGRRLDALGRRERQGRPCPSMQAVLPDDIKVSFEFDQSPTVTNAMREPGDRRGAGRGADRADGAASSSATGGASSSSS